MGKTKCSLCEGLIVNNRCTGCGMYYREESKRYYLNVRRSDEESVVLNEEPEHEKKYRLLEEEKKKTQNTIEKYQKSDMSWEKYASIKPNGKTEAAKANTRKTNTTKINTTKTSTSKVNTTKSYTTGKTVSGNAKNTTKSANKTWGLALSLLIFIGGVAGVLSDQIKEENTEKIYSEEAVVEPVYDEDVYGDEDWDYEDVDIYEYAPYSLDIAGESFTARLEAGTYRVGQQLPEGIYTASTADEWIYLHLSDTGNSIYGSWYMDINDTGAEGEEKYQAYDIRLYQGAVIEIEGDGELILVTHNAQMGKMLEGKRNPLLDEIDEIRLGEETLTAGKDFPAGMYDVQMVNGDNAILNHESEELGTAWYYLDMEDSYIADGRRNFRIEEGDRVWLDMEFGREDTEVVLRPAEITYQ